jgi:hypothetical protein
MQQSKLVCENNSVEKVLTYRLVILCISNSTFCSEHKRKALLIDYCTLILLANLEHIKEKTKAQN